MRRGGVNCHPSADNENGHMSLDTTRPTGRITDRGPTITSGARVLVIFENSSNGAAALAQAAEFTNTSRSALTVVTPAPQQECTRCCDPSAEPFDATVREDTQRDPRAARELAGPAADRAVFKILVGGSDTRCRRGSPSRCLTSFCSRAIGLRSAAIGSCATRAGRPIPGRGTGGRIIRAGRCRLGELKWLSHRSRRLAGRRARPGCGRGLDGPRGRGCGRSKRSVRQRQRARRRRAATCPHARARAGGREARAARSAPRPWGAARPGAAFRARTRTRGRRAGRDR